MEKMLDKLLGSVELGDVQTCGNMSVVPLVTSNGKGISYMTLPEAMEKKSLTVAEVDEGGNVPELIAVNEAEWPVLLIDGKPAGMELIPRKDVYGSYHSKLIGSYVMEAAACRRKAGDSINPEHQKVQARAFLDELASCEETKKKAIGLGQDLRYESDSLTGGALTYRQNVVHAAFFKI